MGGWEEGHVPYGGHGDVERDGDEVAAEEEEVGELGDPITHTLYWVGGWVGGWVGDRKVEGEQAVRMRCWSLWVGGRVGGWERWEERVGGWVGEYRYLRGACEVVFPPIAEVPTVLVVEVLSQKKACGAYTAHRLCIWKKVGEWVGG